MIVIALITSDIRHGLVFMRYLLSTKTELSFQEHRITDSSPDRKACDFCCRIHIDICLVVEYACIHTHTHI